MSNEITINVEQKLINGTLIDNPGLRSFQITQTTALLYDEVVTITTADTALTLGSLAGANYGRCWLQNLDTTNYVNAGPTVAGAIAPMIRLSPNAEPQLFRLVPSITLRMQANTASCKVRIKVYAL